jgi:hypothetical protein
VSLRNGTAVSDQPNIAARTSTPTSRSTAR